MGREHGFPTETSAGVENEKPSAPGKSENEGVQRFQTAHADWAGLILLIDGEVDSLTKNESRRVHTSDILTPGLNLAPAFPVIADQWLLGVCNPLQWRNRSRFSRDSLKLACNQHPTRKPDYFKERQINSELEIGSHEES